MHIESVPIQPVACELSVLGSEYIRSIQAAHVDRDDVWNDFWRSKQQAPAVGTEVANSALLAAPQNAVALGFTGNPKGRFRDSHHWNASSPRGSLAVPTMTEYTEQYVALRLVP